MSSKFYGLASHAGMTPDRLCCIASYDGLKIKKMENISSLLFWYL
ncbi:hypothetical protein [Wolbachia endosymbiont (group A) of Rhinocyllus conicus]|nr:hypothetical protein [Wolbachia endosymbiont (group A) of Rhinocyllus conicus]